MKRAVAAALLMVLLGACRPDATSSLGVAERFIDQYYVQINLAAAKLFCTGLALQKLEEQQRLTAGQAIDESTRAPLVRYKLLETRPENSERIVYLFEGSVTAAGTETFKPKWLITTRRDNDVWKVSNFAEMP